jgi:hypothetical protein
MAAIQASRMGAAVTLLAQSHRIGGMTTNGLGQTDVGNKSSIGGLAQEFYNRIRAYYKTPEAWKWQDHIQYTDGGQTRTDAEESSMWTFEPSAALHVLEQMLAESDATVHYGVRLRDKDSAEVIGGQIKSITTADGQVFSGASFIDATYEGDLLAAAGVSYTVGREDNQLYGESLNGNQPEKFGESLTGEKAHKAVNHQICPKVSGYRIPGDPESGLLPGIENFGHGTKGAGDNRIQAYCFRLCLTDHPKNRIPIKQPENYDPERYELLLRNFESGETMLPLIMSQMPNRKSDCNNRRGYSTDFIGGNYRYPEATSSERNEIFQNHVDHIHGLLWTLQNNPRVPQDIRKHFSAWGFCKDEFTDRGGWPNELYIREARRMLSDYTMTQKNCEGLEVAEDSICLAAYDIDSHHVRRYIDKNGCVQNEGNVQYSLPRPYPISLRSVLPRESEVTNLIVPVCLSASHIAYGSIRMEPVFMMLGQATATIAVMASHKGIPVQKIPYEQIQKKLEEDGAVLSLPEEVVSHRFFA